MMELLLVGNTYHLTIMYYQHTGSGRRQIFKSRCETVHLPLWLHYGGKGIKASKAKIVEIKLLTRPHFYGTPQVVL
jgi:hypothetical protein